MDGNGSSYTRTRSVVTSLVASPPRNFSTERRVYCPSPSPSASPPLSFAIAAGLS